MNDLLKMILVLTGICLVAAVALSQVFAVTKAPIEKAMRMEKLAAIKSVLPEYDNEPDKDQKTIGQRVFYPGTKDGKPVGFAFEAVSPNGYSGDIKVLVGVTADGEINGLEILEHKETPGLGQRIESPEWRNGVVWADDGKTQRRSTKNSKWDVKKDGGDIDQISGATISPRAVVEAMRGGLKDFENARSELGLDGGAGETATGTGDKTPPPADEKSEVQP